MIIPTALRRFTGNQGELRLSGATVADVLGQLAAKFPEIKKNVFTDAGELRNFVNIYLNDEDIRRLGGKAASVKDGDTLAVVPAIAGGAPVQVTPPSVGADPRRLPALSPAEIDRYSRHLMLPEVTMDGQKRLKAASVLIVGAGGLGCPLGIYLAAAGVGRIGIVEFDTVSASNLQRQILYTTKDVGRPKAEVARERMLAMNPEIKVEIHGDRLTKDNALKLFAPYDIVIDGTDNFPTRYLTNDACVLSGKPNVYGSIFRFEGQASVFWAAHGPCYRCLYPEPPPPGMVPSCAEGGVLGVLPGIVGTMQATEAIKLILGQGDPLIGRLMLFDAMAMRFREVRLRKDPACPICGPQATIKQLIDYEQFCGIRGEESTTIISTQQIPTMDVRTLKKRLDARAAGKDGFELIDVREPHEWQISNLGEFGARLIPLAQLAERVHELDSSKEYVVHCKMGGRSAKAVAQLMQMGFRKLHNLAGGINAWAGEIDPKMPRY
jgi:adenylyltransferase/sulfurtransferase